MSSKVIRKINLRSDENIFLVGKCASTILGAKLPSIKQVLQLFFYKIRVENMTVIKSMKYTIGVALEFWNKAKIPTLHETNCVHKLRKIYENWRNIQKNCKAPYEKYRKQEQDFRDKIENFIFDVAAPNALEIMKIQEDKDFLVLQRKRGRPGTMYGVDRILTQKQKRKDKLLEEEKKRVEKHKAQGI